MEQDRIAALLARNIETGELMYFRAPLFADCTGDANVGYMAGADFRTGREARSEYGEPSAPAKADKQVMGASVQWYAQDRGTPAVFPEFVYGKIFDEKSVERVTKGEWTGKPECSGIRCGMRNASGTTACWWFMPTGLISKITPWTTGHSAIWRWNGWLM